MIIMDVWTIAVVVTLLLSLCICLNMAGIAHAIGHLINAPREAEMLRIMDETLKEKYSNDEHKRRLALMKLDEEPVYSDDFHHMDEALRTMATAGRISISPQHQEIEPYIPPPDDAEELRMMGFKDPVGWVDKKGRFYPPPEPLLRYEIVMHDDWRSGGEEEHASSVDCIAQKVHERSQS